ncbi:unnamed protein product [Merluccius merluccius]
MDAPASAPQGPRLLINISKKKKKKKKKKRKKMDAVVLQSEGLCKDNTLHRLHRRRVVTAGQGLHTGVKQLSTDSLHMKAEEKLRAPLRPILDRAQESSRSGQPGLISLIQIQTSACRPQQLEAGDAANMKATLMPFYWHLFDPNSSAALDSTRSVWSKGRSGRRRTPAPQRQHGISRMSTISTNRSHKSCRKFLLLFFTRRKAGSSEMLGLDQEAGVRGEPQDQSGVEWSGGQGEGREVMWSCEVSRGGEEPQVSSSFVGPLGSANEPPARCN